MKCDLCGETKFPPYKCKCEIGALSGKSQTAGSVVYTVKFNDMIYESAFFTVSIHRTKAGAVRAMQKLKTEMFMGEDWGMEQEWSAFRYGKLQVQE